MDNIIKKILVAVFAVSLAFSAAYAINDPAGGATSVGTTGQFTQSSSGTATAQGGNVTYVNVTGNASTSKWQGFYGNVSGGLRLGSGTNVFYDFGNLDFTTVVAAPATDFNWATFAVTTAAEIDTQWSFGTAADVDQAVDIFTSTGTYAGVGSVPDTVIGNGFGSGIVEDGDDAAKGDYAFVGNVTTAGLAGFDGTAYQYQLMVPVETGTETYNFYLSLE